MSSFYIVNFGCRATQADGAAIERQLIEKGLERAPTVDGAQVIVLNTCTVTSSADQDARATIRRVQRDNPSAKILVTGCYAQRAPEEIAKLPGVSIVVGNSHKHALAEIVAGSSRGFVPIGDLGAGVSADTPAAEIFVGDIFAHTELLAAPVFDAESNEKTRPNLKVQDGCNNRCSFCIIPYVRGKSRSLPMNEVLREVDQLVSAGYREIVLSGINLGQWARDFTANDPQDRLRFADLLHAILDKTSIQKVRISSVEPMDWTDDLIELVAFSPRIAKHAHVPMQSGSDQILRRMHRRYRPWHYTDRITQLHQAMPTAAIGADVMVGFPGETDEFFEHTRALVDSLPFTYLHVFTYSSRPGTPSAEMPDQVPVQIARERNRILRELVSEKKRVFQRQFLNTELEAITLTNVVNGRTEALTDNYQKLWIEGVHTSNQLVHARIKAIEGEALVGTI